MKRGPSVAQSSGLTRTRTNRVRGCRVAAGLSQRALAAEAGVSRPTIQRIERGEVVPTAATLAVLAYTLQVRIEDLLPHPNPHDRLAP